MKVNRHFEGFLLDDLAGSFLQPAPTPIPFLTIGDFIKEDIDSIGIDPGPGMAQGAEDPVPSWHPLQRRRS